MQIFTMRTCLTVIGLAVLATSADSVGIAFAQSAAFTASGRVEGAAPALTIGAAAAGVVNEVFVGEGDHVAAGQMLIKLDCRSTAAEVHAREARLKAAQAAYDRSRNGSRPDEIAVGEAVVGYSQARAEEAQKTLDRTEALKEGVTVTTAHILEVQRDARIAAAQLEEAKARLSLLRAGSREEDVRQAKALMDAAAAELEASRAILDQCFVRAPIDGIVLDVLVSRGQYVSLAVPQPMLHIVPAGPVRVRAEVELRNVPQICQAQSATVSSDGFPNKTVSAHVTSISPAITPPDSALHRESETVSVFLNEAGGAPAMPLGSAVLVHFDACPSKT
jgi:multidrug resistance efflux pump